MAYYIGDWYARLFSTDNVVKGLHADSIRKEIGGRQILNDIFLSCQKGEIIGLLGRNGSGKSTLLQVIFGSVGADHKYVAIDGKKVDTLFESRKYIQYLPQDDFLPNHISLKNIICCFCTKEKAAGLLVQPLIHAFLHKKVAELSGGEKRIFEVFLLLYSTAPYLLFDEPFNGISPLHTELLKELIQTQGTDKGIIVTDHSYENVLAIASRVILLDNGNTRLINNRQELVDYGYLPR